MILAPLYHQPEYLCCSESHLDMITKCPINNLQTCWPLSFSPEKPQPWLQPSFRLQEQVRVWRKPRPGPRSDIGGFGRELNVIQFDLLREFSLPPPGPGLNTVVLAPSGACHRQYPLVPKYSSSHNLRSYETLQIPASCCNHTITITIIKTDIQHNTRNLNDLIFNMRLDSNAS